MAEADSIGCCDWRSKPRKFNVDPEWLRTEYAVKKRRTGEIAAEIGCSQEHLNNLVKKFGIPRRDGRAGRMLPTRRASFDLERAKWMYVIDRMSCDDIGAALGVDGATVGRRLRDCGVDMRQHNETKRLSMSRKYPKLNERGVVSRYKLGRCTVAQVASEFGIGPDIVARILDKYGAQRHAQSEVRDLWGDANPNWRHDLTPEEREARRDSSQQAIWRQAVYERDSFTCQKCGDDKGGNLHAHHIEAHCENKEHRWDIENGVTLCSSCHRGFHRRYGLKGFGAEQLAEYLVAA